MNRFWNIFICFFFPVDYVDLDYSIWLTCCLAPLVITFLLPVVIGLLLYLSAFLAYIYKLHWRKIRQTLQTGDKWNAARRAVGALWDAHGWIWHGKFQFQELVIKQKDTFSRLRFSCNILNYFTSMHDLDIFF